eukprot:Trichotokara_eunicae@DN5912_c0_g1_i10.p1
MKREYEELSEKNQSPTKLPHTEELVRVFQGRAPNLAWAHNSITTEACAEVMNDETRDLSVTRSVFKHFWDWDLSQRDVEQIHSLVVTIWKRSAALSAVAICALAKKTGRLQRAMGGVTVGIDGSVFVKNVKYQQFVRESVNEILGEELGSLVHLVTADDGSGKGASVLAAAAVSA